MTRIPKIVLLIESSRASGRALLNGVADYAHYHGPWSFYWEPAGLESAWPVLKSLDADGIIMRDGDRLDEVLALKIPAIVVGHKRKEIAGVVNVVTDSSQIGKMGAEHLIQCGFKHFAFVGISSRPDESASWSQAREESFVQRVFGLGFETRSHHLSLASGRNWLKERATLVTWLKSLPKPVGLMACNDDCGVQVMEACKSAGLAVPDLVGVIGADNDEIVCGLSNPAMSSVAINFERAGFEAAEALHQLMRGEKQLREKISVHATHIATRRSTDVVAVTDAALGKALRFIRDNSRKAIGVVDVAKMAGLSRRALERRFRSEIGISILDQIRKARSEHICKMLVETTLPVGQIAETLGFEDVQHFARYFRSAQNTSPLAYRRSFGKQTRQARAQNGDSYSQTGVELHPHRNVTSGKPDDSN
jgi:LacI family transcriptional regulator